MSYPVTAIPVTGLVEFNPGALSRRPTPAISLPPEPTAAETQAQIARQNAEPVGAVFHANGKVVAVMTGTGGAMFVSNADAPRTTGELNVDGIASSLAQRYGATLSVERYAPGAGPAYGRIMDEIYGTRSSLVDIRA
jgi:hypothetical protein